MPESSARGRRLLMSASIAAWSFAMAVGHSTAVRAETITPQEAHDIAVNANVFLFPRDDGFDPEAAD